MVKRKITANLAVIFLEMVDSKGIEPSTSAMRTQRSRKVVSFLPTDCGVWFDENAGRGADARNTTHSFSIRREWTANLYEEKTKSYFSTMTNLFLTKKDGLVYNGNNSSEGNFFRKLLLFIDRDKRGERMKLQDLASVRSGLVLSRKQAKEPSEYRYPLINLRCIQQEGTIQLKEADIYEAKEPLKEEYLSQSGDIIVRLTAPYTAVLIDETTSGMVVSSNFVVIRVEDKSLLPEYLFWLLNTEKIKRKIYENATSNMLGAVNARFLADFELALLSVEDQRKIAQFNLLAKRERQLLRMLADEKEKYYAGVLNQAYKRAKKGK